MNLNCLDEISERVREISASLDLLVLGLDTQNPGEGLADAFSPIMRDLERTHEIASLGANIPKDEQEYVGKEYWRYFNEIAGFVDDLKCISACLYMAKSALLHGDTCDPDAGLYHIVQSIEKVSEKIENTANEWYKDCEKGGTAIFGRAARR